MLCLKTHVPENKYDVIKKNYMFHQKYQAHILENTHENLSEM